MPIEISRSIEIDMGHRVTNHNGKCSSCHGHRYKIELFAEGPLDTSGSSEGMVVDFSVLKELLLKIDEHFDHAFAVWRKDEILIKAISITDNAFCLMNHKQGFCSFNGPNNTFGKVQVMTDVPTAENLAVVWLRYMDFCLKKNYPHLDLLKLTRIKVWETPNSCVEVKNSEIQT